MSNNTTLQSLFDKAALGILRQGKRSQGDDDKCKYRSEGGRKCAVGFMIPDSLYREEFDDGTFTIHHIASALAADEPELGNAMLENNYFLCRLQSIHDFKSVEEWPSALIQLADQFGLSSAAIEELQGCA